MSDSESLDYLQDEFDPRSMTVPRLRSVLVKHNVTYPSTAKKAQLVDLFNEEVAPQAEKILARHARAKRSSMGIVNMGAQEETHLEPPKSIRRSGSPRKSAATRIKTEEPDEAVFTRTPRSTRSSSRQSTQVFDTDSVRRTRRTVTPRIKTEEPEDDERVYERQAALDSAFSDDNPFQSGSSPLSAKTPKTPANGRRKTSPVEKLKTPRSTRRRQTETPAYTTEEDEYEVERPASRTGRRQAAEPPGLEAGEEFTPDEQLELQQEWASRGVTEAAPQQTTRSGKGFNLTTPFMVLFISLLGAYAAWYRQEKLAVGYCGLGRAPTQILPPDLPVPDWAVPFVEPQCEPCPQHAFCYANFEARCEPGYILVPHPLSAGGLVPLRPTCEPDGEKVRRVKAVADKAVEELRERRAQYECGGTTTEQGEHIETPAVEVEELKETVSRKRNKRLNKQDFDELWAAALGEVKDREEVEVVEKTDSGGLPNTYLSSTSLARLPLACAVKRSIVNALERHRLTIGAVVALFLAALYGRSRYIAERATAAQIPALVDLVLDRLSKQKELGEEDIDDPWLFLPNLRDDVLRSLHSLSARDRIWKRVRVVVEQNSNVRTSQREGRNGEVGRAWEWIGPMAGDGARRRKSGRVSWGPVDVKGEDNTPDYGNRTHSKWEESRPIY